MSPWTPFYASSACAPGHDQYVDLARFDVATVLQASQVTDYLHAGHHPKRAGNTKRFASTSAFPPGRVLLAASNARQHRRFYEAIGDPEEAPRSRVEERHARHTEKLAAGAEKVKEKTAANTPTRCWLAVGYTAEQIAALRRSSAVA